MTIEIHENIVVKSLHDRWGMPFTEIASIMGITIRHTERAYKANVSEAYIRSNEFVVKVREEKELEAMIRLSDGMRNNQDKVNNGSEIFLQVLDGKTYTEIGVNINRSATLVGQKFMRHFKAITESTIRPPKNKIMKMVGLKDINAKYMRDKMELVSIIEYIGIKNVSRELMLNANVIHSGVYGYNKLSSETVSRIYALTSA